MVTQLPNPITREGRLLASEREKTALSVRYQKKKRAQKRGWSAENLAKLGLTADRFTYGPQLPILVPRFYQIERHEGDFREQSRLAFGIGANDRDQQEIWSDEELEHWRLLQLGMIHSNWYSPKQVQEFDDLTLSVPWTFQLQTKLTPTAIRARVYAMAQEDETKRNYDQLMIKSWFEQGCPRDSKGHPLYIGWPWMFQLLKTDEGIHEADFTHRIMIDFKYFPEEVLQAIWDVFLKYRMPIILLSDPELFIKTIKEYGISSLRVPISVVNDARQKFGLKDRHAVLRALENWKKLPADTLIQLPADKFRAINPMPDVPPGSVDIRQVEPDGSFTLVSKKAA